MDYFAQYDFANYTSKSLERNFWEHVQVVKVMYVIIMSFCQICLLSRLCIYLLPLYPAFSLGTQAKVQGSHFIISDEQPCEVDCAERNDWPQIAQWIPCGVGFWTWVFLIYVLPFFLQFFTACFLCLLQYICFEKYKVLKTAIKFHKDSLQYCYMCIFTKYSALLPWKL